MGSGFTDRYIRAVDGCAAKQAMCEYSRDVLNGQDIRPIDNSLLPAAGRACQVGRNAPYLRQINCRDIMPTAPGVKGQELGSRNLFAIDGYEWFRKNPNEPEVVIDKALTPRGCEPKH